MIRDVIPQPPARPPIKAFVGKPKLLPKMLKFFVQQNRYKVILPSSHPHEYFRTNYNPSNIKFPTIPHPTPVAKDTPLYFRITLHRSLLGLTWRRRYVAGVLFNVYQPEKRLKPQVMNPRISAHTVIYREATSEVAELILELKEVLEIENIWTVEEYRNKVREDLKSKGLTIEERQERRGYFIEGSVVNGK
jgi:hypothetical protein